MILKGRSWNRLRAAAECSNRNDSHRPDPTAIGFRPASMTFIDPRAPRWHGGGRQGPGYGRPRSSKLQSLPSQVVHPAWTMSPVSVAWASI
jgi:hypothetical protein